jgi:hypothetical protein
VRSVRLSPPVDWSEQRRLDYVECCRKVVAGLRGTNTMLVEIFDETAESACRAMR